MAALPDSQQFREFTLVQIEIEKAVSILKRTFDPNARVRLLRELRLLIEEADVLISSEW